MPRLIRRLATRLTGSLAELALGALVRLNGTGRLAGLTDRLAVHGVTAWEWGPGSRALSRDWLMGRIESGALKRGMPAMAPLDALRTMSPPLLGPKTTQGGIWTIHPAREIALAQALLLAIAAGPTVEDMRLVLDAPEHIRGSLVDGVVTLTTLPPEAAWALLTAPTGSVTVFERLSRDPACAMLHEHWPRFKQMTRPLGGEYYDEMLLTACHHLPAGAILQAAWTELARIAPWDAGRAFDARPDLQLTPEMLGDLCGAHLAETRLLAIEVMAAMAARERTPDNVPRVGRPVPPPVIPTPAPVP